MGGWKVVYLLLTVGLRFHITEVSGCVVEGG